MLSAWCIGWPALIAFLLGCIFAGAALGKMSLHLPVFRKVHVASWYGESYRGKTMANGELFDPDKMMCATYLYPLGAWLCLSTLDGKNAIVVEVTDRGPHVAGRDFDLSYEAFRRLAPPALGLVKVNVRRIDDVPVPGCTATDPLVP